MDKKLIFCVAVELIGIAAVGTGIGVELATKADIGWAVVTSGSCLVAIGGVIWGKFMRGGKR